ncbi:alpha/beta fold hydrolase [Chryseomicrobium palamuruense]|uniref:Alpha/beta fold hydrolase n=1 Tax=Chryseomicrobium palamuruense TaxID=682973 RepID=A0ABV8UTA2_9BACL
METFWFTMTDGHEIFTRFYSNDRGMGHVHILHGLAEHSGRYDDFARHLISEGYSVSLHDHRGHGETGQKQGTLGYFSDGEGFERVTDDVNEVIHLLKGRLSDKPLILLGHSMGSFIARRFVQKYPDGVSKLVLVGTGGDPGIMGFVGLQLAKVSSRGEKAKLPGNQLNKLTFGSYNKRIPNVSHEFDWLSTDGEVVQAYDQDPLCGFVSTNKLYKDLLTGLRTIHSSTNLEKMRKDLPVLLIAGAEDPVGNYGKGVRDVAKNFAKSGMEQVKLVLIENHRHEILNGHERISVYDEITRWLLEE